MSKQEERTLSTSDIRVMGEVTINPSNTVTLRISRADNQLIVLLNDNLLYSRKTERDPELRDVVELAEFLKTGDNYLNILGIDWGQVGHYAFQLDINGNRVPGMIVDDRVPGTMGLSRYYSLKLIKR